MSTRASAGARRQVVRYVTAADGTRLAWAEAGTGPVVVKAANWLTHLAYEWESPVWRHWLEFFADRTCFVRYDERGCGMSDWREEGLSIDTWAADLHAVIAAARPSGPVTLLGISQGAATCIRYAVTHPERVERLILYGGYARGALRRGSRDAERFRRAMIDIARVGWGHDNPTFRQLFTSRFIPDATPAQLAWFNELCRTCVTAEAVSTLLEARASVDVTDDLPRIRVPTLVLHARRDEVIPLDEGRAARRGHPGR
jgi:pimeloyl-ACP methyl ester carboxylesterase